MNIKEKAKNFAIIAHKEQVRKSDPVMPYLFHPFTVANILEEYGYDDNVISAGYLHDVVEDTKYTLEDIKNNTNEDVASLVESATEKDKSLSWEERKTITINETTNLPLRNKLVIAADKISNLEDLNILFTKIHRKDFTRFNRGMEKQRWYYQNIYKSLINNEDSTLPIFVRLKNAIDTIYEDKPLDEYVENTIFKDNKKRYQELLELHYKKVELKKINNVMNKTPYVIEFTGTPRTGKTTIINNLKDFLNKGGFKVKVIEEITTSEKFKKEIKPKLDNDLLKINLLIPELINDELNKSLQEDYDFIILDRGIFDRMIWINKLYHNKGISKKDYNEYNKKNIKILERTNKIIITYTDGLTAVKRDYYANINLEKRSFTNEQNILDYNNALDESIKLLEKEKYYKLDTTNTNQLDSGYLITNNILDSIHDYYIEEFKKQYIMK